MTVKTVASNPALGKGKKQVVKKVAQMNQASQLGEKLPENGQNPEDIEIRIEMVNGKKVKKIIRRVVKKKVQVEDKNQDVPEEKKEERQISNEKKEEQQTIDEKKEEQQTGEVKQEEAEVKQEEAEMKPEEQQQTQPEDAKAEDAKAEDANPPVKKDPSSEKEEIPDYSVLQNKNEIPQPKKRKQRARREEQNSGEQNSGEQNVEENDSSIYEFVKRLGTGSYGSVFCVKKQGSEYAMKVNFISKKVSGIGNLGELQVFMDTRVDNRAHRCLIDLTHIDYKNPMDDEREIKGQMKLIQKEHRTNVKLDNLYFIMPKLDYSLDAILKKANYASIACHAESIFTQILFGLEFLHAKGICHRDLKVDNILCKITDSDTFVVKISDYGFAKTLSPHSGNSTNILNYSYRAPEIAAQCPYYNKSIDIWSLGVICYKLYCENRYPIDIKEDKDQIVLQKIHDFVSLDNISYRGVSKIVLDRARTEKSRYLLIKQLETHIGKDIYNLFPDKIPHLKNLFMGMFNPDYKSRLTCTAILNSPYFDRSKELIRLYRKENLISGEGKWLGAKDKIVVANSPWRKEIANLAIDLYNARDRTVRGKEKLYRWFTMQIWCASLSLADRWLYYATKHEEILTPEIVTMTYYICVYVIVKILTKKQNYSFSDVAPDIQQKIDFSKDYIELTEQYLLSCTRLRPYHPTLYEHIKDYRDEMDTPLAKVMTKQLNEYHGKTWEELAFLFEKKCQNLNN